MSKTKQLIEENERFEDKVIARPYKSLTKDGREIPDPTPVAPPIGYKRKKSMFELQRDQVRAAIREISAEAGRAGRETFEEADDFDVGDDEDDPRTPYEGNFDPMSADDLAAMEGRLTPRAAQEIEAALTGLQQPRQDQSSSRSQNPVEGGAEPSPEPGSDPPAGVMHRVSSYVRRNPSK